MPLMQDPAKRLEAVTPSDATVLVGVRGIYIGVSGDIAIVAKGGTAPVTLVGAAAGSWYPIMATKVMATGTTAASIVAMY